VDTNIVANWDIQHTNAVNENKMNKQKLNIKDFKREREHPNHSPKRTFVVISVKFWAIMQMNAQKGTMNPHNKPYELLWTLE
jgi:hypothetical protein